ncbi:MAG TPA: type II secretion system F family protein [Actinomycetes bacterium]
MSAALAISLVFVAGWALVASAVARLRRPRLVDRLDPYLRGLVPPRSRLLAGDERPLTPFPTLERLLWPLLEEGARLVDRWVGGSAGVARRLREAGREDGVARFRAEQVLCGLAGFAVAVLAALVVPGLAGGRVSALTLVGAAALGVLGGVLGRDWWLTREVERRHQRMLAEFPTLADLVCLAVTAGEGPRAAIERACARSHGEVSRELAVVLADMRGGLPFTAAMERLAGRVPVPLVARFVDGLVVATERGTPLAEVLRAQAADVREQRKRQLIEAGGRKEVLMLVPVVFLVMPVVVLFALYPGYFSLMRIAR